MGAVTGAAAMGTDFVLAQNHFADRVEPLRVQSIGSVAAERFECELWTIGVGEMGIRVVIGWCLSHRWSSLVDPLVPRLDSSRRSEKSDAR